jgi:energy-coupling factor transport system ATP-binding protein
VTAVDVRDAFRIFEAAAGGTAALQGASLLVEPGEIVVVQGPSGSGKTTLLRILAALDRLSAGRAEVLGVDLGGLDARRAAEFRAASLGLLDQHYARALSGDLTCRQTIAVRLGLLGREPRESRRVADELLGRVGLLDRGDDRPGSLSGGEQQRVAVCAAFAHRPRLLLGDEPAGELDTDNAAIVYGLLGELARSSGAAAVIVSHDAAAASIADRVVQIRDGRVVAEARPGAEPALVVDRGWVRLPDSLLQEAGRPRLALAAGDETAVVLRPLDAERMTAAASGVARRRVAGEVVAELRGVSKRYAARPALFEDLSLEFRAGVFAAVVGRSGTGKTTLLHLLAGLERATVGEVVLIGRAVSGLGRAELAELRRRNVALVTQEPGLVPYLTALENVELGLALRGRPADPARPALGEVGLESRLQMRASRLSAGERQRVAIARALAAGASLVLVDEPTARLDEENARLAASLLARAAHERGAAVVCATHDDALIERADEIVRLEEVALPDGDARVASLGGDADCAEETQVVGQLGDGAAEQ